LARKDGRQILICYSAGKHPGDMNVQFQADRFAMSWTRTKPLGEPDEYPGYPDLKRSGLRHSENFIDGVKKDLE
jgi:hypothetical protein